LLSNFVEETAGVTDAVAVSSDGLVIARSDTLNQHEGDQLCAIISGCNSLADASDRLLSGEGLERVILAMHMGFLFVCSIADGSCLGVVATRDCDVGSVGYQTTELVAKAGELLTPALREELKSYAASSS
jgi:predicted regulator of Ras-like GTPase activity (Roadblock/LC7/MglB family)